MPRSTPSREVWGWSTCEIGEVVMRGHHIFAGYLDKAGGHRGGCGGRLVPVR